MKLGLVLTIIVAILTGALLALMIATHASFAQDNQKISILQSEVSSVRSNVNGSHRDLITCHDLANLDLQYLNAVDLSNNSFTGDIYATAEQSPVSLPAHCINN